MKKTTNVKISLEKTAIGKESFIDLSNKISNEKRISVSDFLVNKCALIELMKSDRTRNHIYIDCVDELLSKGFLEPIAELIALDLVKLLEYRDYYFEKNEYETALENENERNNNL